MRRMVQHQYKVGDRVRLVRGPADSEIPDGVYVVARTLPVEGVLCCYRLQHDSDRHERVVREEQILGKI
jgi:hypothetical protein